MMFKGKGLKPVAFQLWVHTLQRAPPHLGVRAGPRRVVARGHDADVILLLVAYLRVFVAFPDGGR
jgi:hypothetical protein